jgi:1-acyl-sn-glycerol-3-phosphate acyltransferase
MKYLRSLIRLILFFSATFGIYTIWFLGNFFIPNKQFWREIIFRNWARAFVKIAGMKVDFYGTLPERPFFLVSNHLSYMDIPALRSVVDAVFVAKGEIEGWFLGGRIVRDMGNIYVNRFNRRDIPRAGADIIKTLEKGEGVIIFPEGTTSNGEKILPFNSSFLEFAAKVDLPVYYASLSYRTPNNQPPASEAVCWWREDSTLIGHLWQLFQIPEFEAIISFGEEPIQNPNRKELAQELWKEVSERFIPVL